ncbi:SAF domain-containing protein [Actinomadura rubteroloni]|nr:SAF domain-containing protein [Actinomadura rubteroloni]
MNGLRSLLRWRVRHRRAAAALFAAFGAGFGLLALRPPGAAGVGILTAARDLPAGATLRPSDVRRATVPPDAVPAGAARSSPAGRVVAGAMRKGEPFTDARLVDAAGLLRGLPTGTVATPVRIADADAVRLLQPGDRIDILTASSSAAAEPAFAELAPPDPTDPGPLPSPSVPPPASPSPTPTPPQEPTAAATPHPDQGGAARSSERTHAPGPAPPLPRPSSGTTSVPPQPAPTTRPALADLGPGRRTEPGHGIGLGSWPGHAVDGAGFALRVDREGSMPVGAPGARARLVAAGVTVLAVPRSRETAGQGALVVVATDRAQAAALAGAGGVLSVTIEPD